MGGGRPKLQEGELKRGGSRLDLGLEELAVSCGLESRIQGLLGCAASGF